MAIISFILIILMNDSAELQQGEIRCGHSKGFRGYIITAIILATDVIENYST